ncbi:DUF4358 domain-containing protein [Clostridiaceae bacterium NSJ-31]|uniref:DUF4358 domain-containing protein n=2 Tax=Ligaoa zhengdingensis TaxID=2763658 RepID=A0A926I4C6_9FIRM|nr:DUF4358 domain-containing protein [Ligaoa zhengdingensis]MBC8547264.1 DUF4358 domain-containing protein [Ligaoa zhengdingensis]
MKKIMTFLIAAALAATMVACTANNQSSSSSSSEPSSSISESSEPSEDESSESEPEVEVPEANKALGDVITAARDQEINDAFGIIMSKDDPQAQMIGEMLGVSYDDMEAFALSVSPMNVKAYGVAIIKPVEGKGEAIATALKTWVENQQKSFENYLQDQYEIAKAATVETLDDGTIVLVMSENGADVQSAIVEGLKK